MSFRIFLNYKAWSITVFNILYKEIKNCMKFILYKKNIFKLIQKSKSYYILFITIIFIYTIKSFKIKIPKFLIFCEVNGNLCYLSDIKASKEISSASKRLPSALKI